MWKDIKINLANIEMFAILILLDLNQLIDLCSPGIATMICDNV